MQDWFELCLDEYGDLPSVVLIRSAELRWFPREFLKEPVLDLCCGNGFFTSCLGLTGVYGCDIDAQALKLAEKRCTTYRSVFLSDARDLSAFAAGAFNTVFSNCALEHVDGVDQALGSIERVLRPGGHLIMSVPDDALNEWFFPCRFLDTIGLSAYAQRLRAEYHEKQRHLNIHGRDVWKWKLERSGLAPLKTYYLFSEREYRLITFFESFVLDSFPGNFLRYLYSVFRKNMPAEKRKQLWRELLKPVYLNVAPRDSGGELFMVSRKKG